MLNNSPKYIEYTDLLTKEQIDTLNKLDDYKDAEIYDHNDGMNKLDDSKRRCKEMFLDSKTVQWISDEITPKLNTIKNYRFDLCTLGHTRIIEYQEGDFFAKHKDKINLHSNMLKSYSILISLNECGVDYEGGKTILYLGPDETEPYTSVYNDKVGSGVIFSKDIVHEGTALTSGTKKILFLNYMCYVTDVYKEIIDKNAIYNELNEKKYIVLESIDNSLENGDIATFDLEFVAFNDKIFINKFEINGNLVYFDDYSILIGDETMGVNGHPLIAITDKDKIGWSSDEDYNKKKRGEEYKRNWDNMYKGVIFEYTDRIKKTDVYVANINRTTKKCLFNPSNPKLLRKTMYFSQTIISHDDDDGAVARPVFQVPSYTIKKILPNFNIKDKKIMPSDMTVNGLDLILDVVFGDEATQYKTINEPFYCAKSNNTVTYNIVYIKGIVDLSKYIINAEDIEAIDSDEDINEDDSDEDDFDEDDEDVDEENEDNNEDVEGVEDDEDDEENEYVEDNEE